MFDIGASELLVIVIIAVIVIGPKDLPLALRTAGRWIGKMRKVSTHFRTGLDAMVREAEMEDMEKKWRDQNAKIMAEHPQSEMGPLHGTDSVGEMDERDAETPQETKTATEEPVLPPQKPKSD